MGRTKPSCFARKYAPASNAIDRKTMKIPTPVLDLARSFRELIKEDALPTNPATLSVIPFSANFVV